MSTVPATNTWHTQKSVQ